MIPLLSVPPEIERIVYKLQLPIFSKKDTNLTYRALNHYQKMGILQENRADTKMWRKFDGVEYIWIRIVDQLRNLGVRLEDIVNLRTKIFIDGNLGNVDRANFINRNFVQEIAFSIQGNYKLYLVLFSDFSFTFHDSQSLQQWLNRSYKDEPHINIPLYESTKDAWKIIKVIPEEKKTLEKDSN